MAVFPTMQMNSLISGVVFLSMAARKSLWISLYYAGVLAIWNLRNQVIFKEHKPDWEYEISMMKLSISQWFKGWCSESKLQPQSILTDIFQTQQEIVFWGGLGSYLMAKEFFADNTQL